MLVLGLARQDGSILATDAFPVADACGRSPEQVRSCLRRLVAEGLFTRDGQGQRAGQLAPEGDGQGGQAAGLDAAEEVGGPPAETRPKAEGNTDAQGRTATLSR